MKLLLIILTLLCVACNARTSDPLIVDGVFSATGDKRYFVRINNTIGFYTDSLYQVGDTIK